MFKAQQTKISDRVHQYQLWQQERQLSFDEVLYLWESSEPFSVFFTQLLTESSFSAYRWETPAVTFETGDRPFEFVLVDSPGLDRRVDSKTFQDYFIPDGHGIVTFKSLGGDALLVVPSPRGQASAYGHLAAFLRNAPTKQNLALWQTVGRSVAAQISERPLWLNTAGGGVSWLHVRLDSRPKYYRHAPYKSFRG